VYEKDDERAGNRVYGAETAEMFTAYAHALTEDGSERDVVWIRISGTGEEVKAIAGLFGLPESSENINLGLDASEKNFKALAPGGSKYIHVASHGTLGEGGEQPALVLSLIGNEGTGEDGFLTMSEIFNMKTPADMIVLSACETGRGKMEKGEGVAGLSRAFLYAGANSLVVSLWNVDDMKTKDLMVNFYKKLRTGTDREAALTQAKREFIKDRLAPFYWAPFVYIGGN
jgi:CHAT domain-containing protein